MQPPELVLRTRANEYVQGRIAFETLYMAAGELLPQLPDGAARTLAGAIIAAEVEYAAGAERVAAVSAALDREVPAEV